jgi:hypothetical protein
MRLGSNYFEVIMRIPITSGDWPVAFNSTAKYIGRHWPKNKLKLSLSREMTARLMGYNSVHDVQQELLNDIQANSYFSTKRMAESMAVKSILLYELPPLDALRFFNGIPWSNLEVWKLTGEFQEQALPFRVFYDEYAAFCSYVTPVLLADAYKRKVIPHYDFCIDASGIMFDRSTFEALLNKLEPNEEDLKEIDDDLSVVEYFNRHILPLAFAPIEDMISILSPDEPDHWLTPEGIVIIPSHDGRWLLFNKLLNAFYPGAYNATGLKGAIKKLYLMEVIEYSPTDCLFPSSEFGLYQYSQDDEAYLPFGCFGSFVHEHQVFYPKTQLGDFTSDIDNPFIQFLLNQLTRTHSIRIPENITSPENLSCINDASTIFGQIINSAPNWVASLKGLGIEKVFANLHCNVFYGDETLIGDEDFDIGVRTFENDEERTEAEEKIREHTEYCDSLGNSLLGLYPELEPYYSSLALGNTYHNAYAKNDDEYSSYGYQTPYRVKAERNVGFFGVILSLHVCEVHNEIYKGLACKAVRWLLIAIESGRILMKDFNSEYISLMELHSKYEGNRKLINALNAFFKSPQKTTEKHKEYVMHGELWKPVVKKSGNSLANLFRDSRKLSSYPAPDNGSSDILLLEYKPKN